MDGSRVRVNPNHVTLALNKPKRVLSAMDDPKGRYTLRDIVGDKYERIFHMGRLDYDSEGLILMTNDGELSQHVMHPKYEVEKTYIATLDGRISGTVCRRLVTTGVQLDDGWIKLDRCAILDSSRDSTLVKVVLHSGKNRIVRRIFGSIGFPVRRLVRTQIGPIKLGDLKSGTYRVLSQVEVRSCRRRWDCDPCSYRWSCGSGQILYFQSLGQILRLRISRHRRHVPCLHLVVSA